MQPFSKMDFLYFFCRFIGMKNRTLPSSFSLYLRCTLSLPFIWVILFPVVILDIFVEVYHRICFPLYGFTYVERGEYIRIDRHHLKYLKRRERMYCMYCGYVNGFFHYASAIAWETELFWCAIKHSSKAWFRHPPHHIEKGFAEYNDQEWLENRFGGKK